MFLFNHSFRYTESFGMNHTAGRCIQKTSVPEKLIWLIHNCFFQKRIENHFAISHFQSKMHIVVMQVKRAIEVDFPMVAV